MNRQPAVLQHPVPDNNSRINLVQARSRSQCKVKLFGSTAKGAGSIYSHELGEDVLHPVAISGVGIAWEFVQKS